MTIKVSGDGANWKDAVRINKDKGSTTISALNSQQIDVPFEQVGSVLTPSKSGLVIIAIVDPNYPQIASMALLAFNSAASPTLDSVYLGGSATNLGTTALTGTTGSAGMVSYAVDGSGKLYIENRFSGGYNRKFSLTFLNCSADG